MSKDIKDYLHYYLGCDFLITPNEDENPYSDRIEGLVIGESVNFKKYGDYYLDDVNDAEAKPILRPLSDMTEDEMAEASTAWLNGNNMDKKPESFKADANMVHYLLSKHFDLFGLIESGLAISKTKTHE